MLRESGHEHLNGSLVVPIFDEEGRVVEMYGRKVGEKLRKGTPQHLYLPGPHRGVFNWQALRERRRSSCASRSSTPDVLVRGPPERDRCYGVEGFTDEQREALRRHGTERVLIAYDRDEAGERAAEKLARELGATGIELRG